VHLFLGVIVVSHRRRMNECTHYNLCGQEAREEREEREAKEEAKVCDIVWCIFLFWGIDTT
jgi:hypothetical protein